MRCRERFDSLNPAGAQALRADREKRRDRHDVPLNLCGEMAGKPLDAMALIGLGFRSISMAPAAIGPVKAMVLSLDAGDLWAEIGRTGLKARTRRLREDLKRFAAEKGVQI